MDIGKILNRARKIARESLEDLNDLLQRPERKKREVVLEREFELRVHPR